MRVHVANIEIDFSKKILKRLLFTRPEMEWIIFNYMSERSLPSTGIEPER